MIKRMLRGTARLLLLSGLALGSAVAAADGVKIGVIGPFSGPNSLYGTGWQQAFTIFMEEHGGKIAGQPVTFVYRDLPTADPQRARALALELAVRDKVDYLTGFAFTADVMAIAGVTEEAEIPTIALNAGGADIIKQSPYLLRTSFTLPQEVSCIGNFAADEGAKTAVTIVSDFVPGREGEETFTKYFEQRGGKVVEKIRMPLSTTDFGPFLQRVRMAKPDVMYVTLPGGPATYAFTKAYLDSGMRQSGVRFLGTGETQEFDLQAMGEGAVGLETGFIYSAAHDGEANRKYAEALAKKYPQAVLSLPHTEAYDAMTLFARMIEATGGKRDGAKAIEAVTGFEWEGLRGPMKIDAERGLVQNVYMRRVERDPDTKLLVNREFRICEMVPETGMPKP